MRSIHKQRLGCLKQSGQEELELNGTINRFEHGSLNQLRKKQKTIQFLPKALRPLATKVTAKDTCDATDSMIQRTCEGIIRAYRSDTSLQKKLMLMFNIVLYCHQQCMWLGQCYGMDCPRCSHNSVPPTKLHIRSMLKYFSVQNVVMFYKYCDCSFVITETAFQVYSHTVTLSLQLPKWFNNQTDHRKTRW